VTRPKEQSKYLDQEGFRDFSERDKWEISLEKQLPIRADEAWNAWFTRVWEGQPAPVMLNTGQGPGRIGSARTVRRAGLTERIVSAGVPSSPSQSDAIPSISYTLEHFAVSSYLGYVCFVPTGPDGEATRVIWSVRWTPSLAGRLLFFNEHLLVRMLRPAMRQSLDQLES
jgi:hypothetical protein